jgi:hypothetical protein
MSNTLFAVNRWPILAKDKGSLAATDDFDEQGVDWL